MLPKLWTSKIVVMTSLLFCGFAYANDAQLKRGKDAIKSQTGCFLIDYSYTETEGIKPGYIRDTRVYDVNKDKSVKEWIFAEDVSPQRIRLQHILFATDLDGTFMKGSLLKHQAEDWEYGAEFLYDFTAPLNWTVKDLKSTPNLWTRRITNLDDGLRYQCAAQWTESTVYPEWSCDNYAPIPGRETRDMGRKDYNTLQRSTRIVAYGNSWLERQANTKTIHESDGSKTPLARELGKNWYVRLPDSDCAMAQGFVQPRLAFWTLLSETWSEVLVGDRPFIEMSPSRPSRYEKIMELEDLYYTQDLSDSSIRKSAKDAITKVIEAYRVN